MSDPMPPDPEADVLSRTEDTAASEERLRELFRRLASGRTEGAEGALAEIYDRLADDLYGLALWAGGQRDLAAEAVQEVFVRLASTRANLLGVRKPRAYLLTAVRRAVIDLQRRQRPHEDLETAGEDAELVVAEDPARTAEARTASRHLARLPRAQREAVHLRCMIGCSFSEIGTITGVSTFTAASRYRLGIARLRRRLGVEI